MSLNQGCWGEVIASYPPFLGGGTSHHLRSKWLYYTISWVFLAEHSDARYWYYWDWNWDRCGILVCGASFGIPLGNFLQNTFRKADLSLRFFIPFVPIAPGDCDYPMVIQHKCGKWSKFIDDLNIFKLDMVIFHIAMLPDGMEDHMVPWPKNCFEVSSIDIVEHLLWSNRYHVHCNHRSHNRTIFFIARAGSVVQSIGKDLMLWCLWLESRLSCRCSLQSIHW